MSAPAYERRTACTCGRMPQEHPEAEMLEDEPAITLDDALRLEGLPPLPMTFPEWPLEQGRAIAELGQVMREIGATVAERRRFYPNRQLEVGPDGLLTQAELERLRKEQRRRESPYIGSHITTRYVVRTLDSEGGTA